jgi:hypothetical protein
VGKNIDCTYLLIFTTYATFAIDFSLELIYFFIRICMFNMSFCPNTFNNLSLSSKSSYLWTHGELLFTRRQEWCIIRLYALFGHLVEVYFKSSDMQVEKIIMLESSSKLQFYEKYINLPVAMEV